MNEKNNKLLGITLFILGVGFVILFHGKLNRPTLLIMPFAWFTTSALSKHFSGDSKALTHLKLFKTLLFSMISLIPMTVLWRKSGGSISVAWSMIPSYFLGGGMHLYLYSDIEKFYREHFKSA